MSKSIKGYIYNTVSYEGTYKDYSENTEYGEIKKCNFVDIFYIDLNKKITLENYRDAYSCIRVYNFKVSFYLCKLPGLTNNGFKKYCQNILRKMSGINYYFTTEYNGKPLKDSMYFAFNNPMLYLVVESLTSSQLNKAYTTLKKNVKQYYSEKLNPSELNEWDRVFYDNTETPFRFDMTTLNANNLRYYLSTKYNIPCVGGFVFKAPESEITFYNKTDKEQIPGLLLNDKKTANNTIFYNVQEDNKKLFKIKHDDEINGQQFLTLLSYDIETYDSDKELTEDEKYIMCIGVGLFNITDDKPFKRWCISSRDLTENDKELLRNENKLINEKRNNDGSITYTITKEYSEGERESGSFKKI